MQLLRPRHSDGLEEEGGENAGSLVKQDSQSLDSQTYRDLREGKVETWDLREGKVET